MGMGRAAWALCGEGASGQPGRSLCGEWTLDEPLRLSPGSWGSRLPTGLVSRPFQGKILFLVQLPSGPLLLLTILLSICKSFNVEDCHPESDSGGWWSLSTQALGCPIPVSSKATPHLVATSQAASRGSPGSQKLAVLTYLAKPLGAGCRELRGHRR